jgi:hypothetical protein
MGTPTTDVARRLERLPEDLQAEFPDVGLETIQGDVETRARELLTGARFDDFVPVLVHRAVRESLRTRGTAEAAA